jgi:hypothetical protein
MAGYPNLRYNALRLGVRLLAAAANPWSGLTRQAAHTISWQPVDPFGMPRWWPLKPAESIRVRSIVLMRSVLPHRRAHPRPNQLPAVQSTSANCRQAVRE